MKNNDWLKTKAISMERFLKYYLGIEDEQQIEMLSTLTHRELKEIFPSLKSVGFKYVRDNTYLLHEMSIVIVCDAKGNIAPYMQRMLLDGETLTANEGNLSPIKNENCLPQKSNYNFGSMSLYELAYMIRSIESGTPLWYAARRAIAKHPDSHRNAVRSRRRGIRRKK